MFKILLLFIFINLNVYAQIHEDHHHDITPLLVNEGVKDAKALKWNMHGNAFFVQPYIEGPRGKNKFSIPNMLMIDAEKEINDQHTFNVNLMLSLEKWTFSDSGYPELLQIGEENKDHVPYVDAQHPHSSPVMGLTFSDTIKFSSGNLGNYLKIFAAPRGEATEGPIFFMHRETGMRNPDAPLGHHLAQDVSHISSSVLGFSLKLQDFKYEASVFNGTEPEPTKVDLPIASPNSYAFRFIYDHSDVSQMMISMSRVKSPEGHDPTLDRLYRYSASFYYNQKFPSVWMLHNSFIIGLINYYDHYSKLRSLTEEFALLSPYLPHSFWGRFESVERGARQLNINSSDEVHWVHALTFGYTYDLFKNKILKVGIGSSANGHFLPSGYEAHYGNNPLSGKIFVQLMYSNESR